MGRLKELVARVSGGLNSLKKQVEQADAIFGAGAVIKLVSLVPKSLPFLFTKYHSFSVTKLQCSSL